MPATSAKQAKVEPAAAGDADSSLNDAQHAALEEIDACQTEIDALNEKASEEILKVEQKFNNLRKPHFTKRNDICAKISDFWFTTFTNHPQISDILSDDETECLSFLSSLNVDEFEDIKAGYKITFTFKENPFFTNDKLEKEFHLAASGEPQSKSTKIEWKEGKDLATKNGKAETNGDRKRKLTSQSFFSWFNDNGDPNTDIIAEVIKDDVWPNPLQYYLASEFDSAENVDSDDMSEDLDGGEDDDEQDENEEDDDGDEVHDVDDEDDDDEGKDEGEEEED